MYTNKNIIIIYNFTGIFFLESGSVLELSVPRKSADLILKPYSTFFGLFSL